MSDCSRTSSLDCVYFTAKATTDMRRTVKQKLWWSIMTAVRKLSAASHLTCETKMAITVSVSFYVMSLVLTGRYLSLIGANNQNI